jgi:molybdate transport system substrate-binding protein
VTILRSAVALTAIALNVAACSAGAPSAGSGSATLTIYGAASLAGALDRVKPAWEAAHPGSILTISTDSSATLETQIEQGAPADVFLAADTTNPGRLVDRGLAAGVTVPFAANRLTIVVPAANPAQITSPADLARPGVKIVAAGDAVPITTYAARLIANLAGRPGYPPAFAAACSANVVSREDNVRAVVAKVELGEGDAGIVYRTDARASTRVATIDVPDSANVDASYAGVVVKASPNAAAARSFLDWLAGPDGRAILAGLGFEPPS